jgi:hypothetical protein
VQRRRAKDSFEHQSSGQQQALPLIQMARLGFSPIKAVWVTAIFAAVGNIFVLRNRLSIEECLLDAVPDYRDAMSGKPRFLRRIL